MIVVVDAMLLGLAPQIPEAIKIVPANTAAASVSNSSRDNPPPWLTRAINASTVTCCNTKRR